MEQKAVYTVEAVGFLEGLEYARTYATINWWDGASDAPTGNTNGRQSPSGAQSRKKSSSDQSGAP